MLKVAFYVFLIKRPTLGLCDYLKDYILIIISIKESKTIRNCFSWTILSSIRLISKAHRLKSLQFLRFWFDLLLLARKEHLLAEFWRSLRAQLWFLCEYYICLDFSLDKLVVQGLLNVFRSDNSRQYRKREYSFQASRASGSCSFIVPRFWIQVAFL